MKFEKKRKILKPICQFKEMYVKTSSEKKGI